MRGVFRCGLGGGRAFWKFGNNEGFVPPAGVPGAGESDFAVTLLPEAGFFGSADQRENCAGEDGDVGAADDFQQAKGVGHLLIAPGVTADYGDAEDFCLWGLNEEQEGLHVAAARAGAVLVDNDFAAGLRAGGASANEERECKRKKMLDFSAKDYLCTITPTPSPFFQKC